MPKNNHPMRYFLTGLGLFLLMTLFVRAWFIESSKPPKVVINESPIAPKDIVQKTPGVIFSGVIMLKDNLLLKSADYQEIEKAVKTLRKYPKAKLDIFTPIHVDSAKINNTFRTIFADQGILATRFQFLRKQSKDFQILLQVK